MSGVISPYPVDAASIDGVTVTGTPSATEVLTATSATAADWQAGGGGGGTVDSVTAADTSITVGGTGANPTVATGTLDVIATQHPPAAAVPMNAKKITGLANGSASTDAAAFGQLPVLAAADTSVTVAGTATAPTVATGTLDVIATQHPPAAAVPMNAKKITGLANGSASTDAAAFGQIPAALPPNGSAGGNLSGSYPNPGFKKAAAATFNPGNPTATASTTVKMMGLGATIAYTPASSGKVLVVIAGVYNTNTAAVNITMGFRYGTGTAPTNGASPTGTEWGYAADAMLAPSSTPTGFVPFSCCAVLTLTPATAYWFDIALATSNASDTAQVQNVTCAIEETA